MGRADNRGDHLGGLQRRQDKIPGCTSLGTSWIFGGGQCHAERG
jgi:hypothetical protein